MKSRGSAVIVRGLTLGVQALLGIWIVLGLLLLPDTGAWLPRAIAAAVLVVIWAGGGWLIARRLSSLLLALVVPLASLAATTAVFAVGVAIAALLG